MKSTIQDIKVNKYDQLLIFKSELKIQTAGSITLIVIKHESVTISDDVISARTSQRRHILSPLHFMQEKLLILPVEIKQWKNKYEDNSRTVE